MILIILYIFKYSVSYRDMHRQKFLSQIHESKHKTQSFTASLYCYLNVFLVKPQYYTKKQEHGVYQACACQER